MPAFPRLSIPLLWLTVGAQVIFARDSHQVRGRFELTDSPGEIRFVFEIQPSTAVAPVVRRLGATPRHDSTTLDVQSAPEGRYVVLLRNLASDEQGLLQIEVKGDGTANYELHRADFALRSLTLGQLVSAPDFSGNFVVQTAKAPAHLTLLIASTKLPLDALPAGVADTDVVAAYSLDSRPPADLNSSWTLTIGSRGNARSVFYRSKTAKNWQPAEATLLPDQGVFTLPSSGTGTWLVVRRASQ